MPPFRVNCVGPQPCGFDGGDRHALAEQDLSLAVEIERSRIGIAGEAGRNAVDGVQTECVAAVEVRGRFAVEIVLARAAAGFDGVGSLSERQNVLNFVAGGVGVVRDERRAAGVEGTRDVDAGDIGVAGRAWPTWLSLN